MRGFTVEQDEFITNMLIADLSNVILGGKDINADNWRTFNAGDFDLEPGRFDMAVSILELTQDGE